MSPIRIPLHTMHPLMSFAGRFRRIAEGISPCGPRSAFGLCLAGWLLLALWAGQPSSAYAVSLGVGTAIDDADPASEAGLEFTALGSASGSGALGSDLDPLNVETRTYGAHLAWTRDPLRLVSDYTGTEITTESSLTLDEQRRSTLGLRVEWLLDTWMRPYAGYQWVNARNTTTLKGFDYEEASLRRRRRGSLGATLLLFGTRSIRPYGGLAVVSERLSITEQATGVSDLEERFSFNSVFVEGGVIAGAKPGENGFRLVLGGDAKRSPRVEGEVFHLEASTRSTKMAEVAYGFEDGDHVSLAFESVSDVLDLENLVREEEKDSAFTLSVLLDGTWTLATTWNQTRSTTLHRTTSPEQVSTYLDTTTTLVFGVTF